MAFPMVDPAELAARLQVADSDPRLGSVIAVAVSIATDRGADEDLAELHPEAWAEGITQLAVKVWDSGRRGLLELDPAGDWQAPTLAATEGMWRAVVGVLSPCLTRGAATGFA
jgi:hypothetical protein